MAADLESAQSLADLQGMIEFDIDVLETTSGKCADAGMPAASRILSAMAGDLRDPRKALIKCGVWEDESASLIGDVN